MLFQVAALQIDPLTSTEGHVRMMTWKERGKNQAPSILALDFTGHFIYKVDLLFFN